MPMPAKEPAQETRLPPARVPSAVMDHEISTLVHFFVVIGSVYVPQIFFVDLPWGFRFLMFFAYLRAPDVWSCPQYRSLVLVEPVGELHKPSGNWFVRAHSTHSG